MELFSDITLEIADDNNTIILPFYRIILYNSSEYFKKLLTTFMEKDLKRVKINVPNADIAYNIITNFIEKYSFEAIEKRKINISPWEYIIEEYKCLDYFMLEKDITKIYNLIVPHHYYDQLVNFVDTIGYDSKTIKLLNNNLPPDYDLSDFPIDLLNKMYKLSINHEVTLYCKDKNDFFEIKLDLKNREIIQKNKLNFHITNMNEHNILYITPDHSKFITQSGENIDILNNNGILIKSFKYTNIIIKLFVTNNCIIFCSCKIIEIFNIDNIDNDTPLMFEYYPIYFATCYNFSLKYNQIICGQTNGNIMVINLETGRVRNYNHNNMEIKHVNILGPNKYLSIIDDNIKIWVGNTCLKSSKCVLYCIGDYNDADIFTIKHENNILIGINDTIMIHDATDLNLIKKYETQCKFSCMKHLYKTKFLQLQANDINRKLYIYDLKKNLATKIFDIDGKIFDFSFSTNIENETTKKIAYYLNK
ncbi:putative BTB/POZ domain-containing protein [Cotonvirus japonicus]|uniref:BTB/POZ domain-containing protein n=1 Tax=Cotonvirus japonicus TaxID=2811091 RepID=A0ABM7NQV7_9VIRU|nr:putative BTB/POZ domain-containing protein [Cotonvirus japonicus]BCS82541.1 putative BTB/POZ domain-containing protein [Cotonvirus japonicus]